MNLKNLILSITAFLLACCLGFLLFIATNQQALAKVHETISNCTEDDQLTKDNNRSSSNSVNAAVKNDKQEEPFNANEYVPIAKNTTHNLQNNEIGESNLPQFSNVLKKAQSLVNDDNNASNPYNDYGIDRTCQGTYYYILTFENKEKPGTYYRVTVDQNNKANIFDKSYRVQGKQKANEPKISPKESEVIAEKYAKDELGNGASLKNVKASKDGMFYTFHESKSSRDYKVIVNKSGDVIRQPSLN
ncbi:hypothetical protein ABDK10_01055 [Staphylococcus aureus]